MSAGVNGKAVANLDCRFCIEVTESFVYHLYGKFQ